MISRLTALLSLCLAFVLMGCGGGGGGTPAGQPVSVSGTVTWLTTGGPPTPAATVQIGSVSVLTNLGDGSFLLTAARGSTSALVVSQAVGGLPVSFRFEFPPLTDNTDLGDLIIGPEKVNVVGRVQSSSDNTPIAGATVTFAGRTVLSTSTGIFTLTDVAYDSSRLDQFFALQGRASASGFFARTFSPLTEAVSGTVSLDDILLPSDSGDTPPGTPANIEGFINPSADAPGTVVTLLQGGVPVRQFNVGTSRYYGFWVVPGSYTIRYANPTNNKTAPDASVMLNRANEIIRKDVTLQ